MFWELGANETLCEGGSKEPLEINVVVTDSLALSKADLYTDLCCIVVGRSQYPVYILYLVLTSSESNYT